MKAVLISINPIWCEEIASGKKTVEIRKTKPKLDAPFRCFIYETQSITDTPWVDEDGHLGFKGRGAVIGEFFCYYVYEDKHGEYADVFEEKGLVPLAMQKQYGGNKPLYGWKIAELKIYDKPKPLSEFGLNRPPQSWQYVEV